MSTRELVLSYISPSTCPHAHGIDSITPPFVYASSSALSHRKYLHTHARSAARIATLHRFAATPASLLSTPFPYSPPNAATRYVRTRAMPSTGRTTRPTTS
jgi:hypothetical protein